MAWADDVKAGMRRDAEQAMRKLVAEVHSDLVELIGIPVQSGSVVLPGRIRAVKRKIRSKPGEPPRKETGQYIKTIKTAVDGTANEIIGRVFTDDPLGRWLEHGTGFDVEDQSHHMAPRPHWSVIAQRWDSRAGPRFVELLGNG